jgi:selenocysteine lyase/cysteine desulfurase
MYDEHHIVMPLIRWNGRLFARISVQGYTEKADIDVLLKVLGHLTADFAP